MFLKLNAIEVERYSMFELGLLFGHKLSHLKYEIHAVMHLSQQRLQTRSQNINSSSSYALALKGDGRLNSHWFVACYPQNTPTGFRPTHFRFASGARVIYLPVIATVPEIRPQS